MHCLVNLKPFVTESYDIRERDVSNYELILVGWPNASCPIGARVVQSPQTRQDCFYFVCCCCCCCCCCLALMVACKMPSCSHLGMTRASRYNFIQPPAMALPGHVHTLREVPSIPKTPDVDEIFDFVTNIFVKACLSSECSVVRNAKI